MAKFQPGQSGNPGGRPAGVRRLLVGKFGADAKRVIEGIEKLAFGKAKTIPPKVRLDALKTLLAYHSGPPPQSVELADANGNPIGPITVIVKGRDAA